MSYLVLARKWRPLTFDQMVGQGFICRTLQNAVKTGRVAHAFLFSGSRGVGKTSAARILAKCLNCDEGPSPQPCNQCSACQEIIEGRSLDVYEIDGASNTSVDDVRELRENIKYMPRAGKRRVYIIDEVHMLSKSAFNALLKTLEEPPEHVVFIFATTEPHKVPETIQSRCQRFDFRRIPRPQLFEKLQEMIQEEQLEISDNALTSIVKAADGSMRDAQSLLDQIISFCGATITDEAAMEILGVAGRPLFLKISGAVLGQDAPACIEALDELYRQGHDISQFYHDLVEHFRNILMTRLLPDPASVLQMAEVEIEDLRKQANLVGPEDLRRLVTMLLKAEGDILRSSFPRMGLEVTLIKMAHLARLEPLDKVLEKISALEGSLAGGHVPGGTRAPSRPVAVAKEPPNPQPARSQQGKPVPRPAASGHKPPAGNQGTYKDFLEAVRRERSGLAAILEDVARWEVEGATVKAFCDPASFLYGKLCHRDEKDFLVRIARECFGPSAAFLVCPLEKPASRAPATASDQGNPVPASAVPEKPPPSEEEAPENPVVQQAMDLFQGTLTDVKTPAPGSGKKGSS